MAYVHERAFILRRARREDAAEIARLFLVSSDGLAAYIWAQLALPGESLEAVGARRYAREGVAFSYENCLLLAQGGQVLGMAHAYPMAPRDPAEPPESDPVLAPYAELEDPGSLYLSGLALKARGRGLGTALLRAVAGRALDGGLPRVSLICFEANAGAMRLYLRHGFQELARRPLVPHPALHYAAGDAILLVVPSERLLAAGD